MTKSELINKACKNADISCIEFTQGFNQMIEVIKKTISSGEPIFITTKKSDIFIEQSHE